MTRPLLVLLALLTAAASARPVTAQDAAPDTLTVVTLNVWHDQRDWPLRMGYVVRDLAALRPDVVLLQEVLQDEDLPNQAEALAEALGMSHVHFVSIDSAGAVKRYGNAVLSTRPFVETGQIRLPPLDAFRTAASARIEVGGRPVRLYATHLHNPQTADGAGARAMEIAHLLRWIAADGDAPLVLGGDFNATPDAPEMRMLDGFRDLGGASVTYGPAYGAGPGRRIDYLFDAADPRLQPVEAGRALDRPDAEGRYPSDHFAVYARFVLL